MHNIRIRIDIHIWIRQYMYKTTSRDSPHCDTYALLVNGSRITLIIKKF